MKDNEKYSQELLSLFTRLKKNWYETKLKPFEENYFLLHDYFDVSKNTFRMSSCQIETIPRSFGKIKWCFHCSKWSWSYWRIFIDSCEVGECHYLFNQPAIKKTKDNTNARILFGTPAKSEGPRLNEWLFKCLHLTLSFLCFHTLLNIFSCHDIRQWKGFCTSKYREGWSRWFFWTSQDFAQ